MTTPYHLHTDQRGLVVRTRLTPQQERDRQLALLERHLWRRWLLGWLAFALLLLGVVVLVGWLCWPRPGAKAGQGALKGAAQIRLGGVHPASVARPRHGAKHPVDKSGLAM